jgi:hypothetical protein
MSHLSGSIHSLQVILILLHYEKDPMELNRHQFWQEFIPHKERFFFSLANEAISDIVSEQAEEMGIHSGPVHSQCGQSWDCSTNIEQWAHIVPKITGTVRSLSFPSSVLNNAYSTTPLHQIKVSHTTQLGAFGPAQRSFPPAFRRLLKNSAYFSLLTVPPSPGVTHDLLPVHATL